jgi:hypothetical protein
VDATLDKNIVRLHVVAQNAISSTGVELRRSLDRADQLLRERSADIERMTHGVLDHADEVLEARIAQLDELATRQLGNVDVIATKQRIALEKGAIQIIIIAGAISFIVFALKRGFEAYTNLKKSDALANKRGAARTALLASHIGPAIGTPLVAGLAGALVLFGLYRWLPLGAVHEARDLQALHWRELDASVARFDYASARFHASHVLYLDPTSAAAAMAQAEKVALLRDLAYRPTLLATDGAATAFERRVDAVESQLGPLPDPDLLVMRALILWRRGTTRADEHVAASLMARAMRLAPLGFPLSPLAREYVATFLAAPYVSEKPGLGRNSVPLDELRDVLASAPVDPPGSPFAAAAGLARMMRELGHTTGMHYIAMVDAHAAAVAGSRTRDMRDPLVTGALARRREHAQAISSAWSIFDQRLRNTPELDGPQVLDIFHLNDAMLTRARWFLAEPDSLAEGKRIEDLPPTTATVTRRLQVAPARVAWARRYSALLAGPLRAVVEFEETERFRVWERWCLEFEKRRVELEVAQPSRDQTELRWRLAVASSALSLFQESENGPEAYAAVVGRDLPAEPPPAVLALTPDAPATLEELLLQRGPRLI